MIGDKLLGSEDPSKVTYSFVLYERGPQPQPAAHPCRQPESALRHQLGRQVAARLHREVADDGDLSRIIAELHRRLAQQPRRAVAARGLGLRPADHLGRVISGAGPDRSLQPMLDAAMQRHYSAARTSSSPAAARRASRNFESWEDSHPHGRATPSALDQFVLRPPAERCRDYYSAADGSGQASRCPIRTTRTARNICGALSTRTAGGSCIASTRIPRLPAEDGGGAGRAHPADRRHAGDGLPHPAPARAACRIQPVHAAHLPQARSMRRRSGNSIWPIPAGRCR